MPSKEPTGVLDIPRKSNKRQKRIRTVIYLVAGLVAIAGITIFLWRLKPAEPVVDKATIWVDTVKRGPMVIEAKGSGILAPQTKGAKATSNSTTVQLRIPAAQVKAVRAGDAASINTRDGTLSGHVVAFAPVMVEGFAAVIVQLDGPAPKGTSPNQPVDGTIQIEKLDNATYVGRPAFAQPDTTVGLFKLDPDGKGASFVQVRLGRALENSVEVLSGLQPDDKVILSDMSTLDTYSHIRLE